MVRRKACSGLDPEWDRFADKNMRQIQRAKEKPGRIVRPGSVEIVCGWDAN
jgi:hypothetical protein